MSTNVEALGEWIAEQAAHLDAATHRLLTAVREFDAAGGWYAQGAHSCAEWLSWRVGWSRQTARDRVRVAQRLGELPLIDDELRRGALSYCKVRALTRVATAANEAALVELAKQSTGAQLDRICRSYAAVQRQGTDPDPHYDDEQRYLTRRDLDNGFVEISARLHPEEATVVWAALDRIVRERAHARTRALPDAAEASPATAPSTAPDGSTLDGLAGGTVATNHVASSTTPTPDGTAPDGSTLDGTTRHAAALGAVPTNNGASSPAPASTTLGDGAGSTIGTSDRVSSSSREPASSRGVAPAPAPARSPFRRVDALVEMAEATLRGDRPERSPVELVVTIDAATLCDPAESAAPIGTTSDGTCVSAETVRRLACDCGVVPLVVDAAGRTVSVGRKMRSLSAALKRALLRRDHTCRFPGCQNRLFLQGHHIEHWANGGETALGNLIGLCSRHHRWLHEYGYRVELDAMQQPRFFDPKGRRIVDAPLPPASAHRGWDIVLDANRDLAITADTPACGWDGRPIEYAWVIDALLSAERDSAERGAAA